MRHVITYAEFHGWLVYHTFDSRRSGAGFPDLFMVRGNRAVAIECKASKGRVTDDQRRWLQALGFAGSGNRDSRFGIYNRFKIALPCQELRPVTRNDRRKLFEGH